MKIRTSDGRSIFDTSAIEKSIQTIQKNKIFVNLKKRFKGNDIDVVNIDSLGQHRLESKILDDLGKMRLCQRNGQIYSGNKDVFTCSFAENVVDFLESISSWLKSTKQHTALTSYQVRDALKWITPTMEAIGCYSRPVQNKIDRIIRKLEQS